MSEPGGFIADVFSRFAKLTGSRSSVLAPTYAPLAIVAALTFLGAKTGERWLLIGGMVACGLMVATFVAGFFYCLIKRPDSLRSERYSLSKMAIQKRLVGDSRVGMKELLEGIDAETPPSLTGGSDR